MRLALAVRKIAGPSAFLAIGAGVSCGGRILDQTNGYYDASQLHDGGSEFGAVDGSQGSAGSVPTKPSGIYRLETLGSLPAPALATGGIAYDGAELWMLSLTGDPQPFRLLRFPLGAVVADELFTLPWLYDGTTATVGGITWNGSGIVVGIIDGKNSKLETIDMSTHQVSQSMVPPSTFAAGVAFDGTDFFISDGASTVLRLDRAGSLVGEIPTRVERIVSLASRAGELFVIGDSQIAVFDPSSGGHLGDVTLFDGFDASSWQTLGPAVFAGDDLYMLCDLDAFSGTYGVMMQYKVARTP